MKEKRFIELLNLYVDHQLDPAAVSELEYELKNNPARHRTYLQYSRMQKACSLLFEAERSSAPSASILARAMAKADRRVAHPLGLRPGWHRGLLAFGGLAAAACMAVVLVRFNRDPAALPIPSAGGAQAAVVAGDASGMIPSRVAGRGTENTLHAVVTVPGLARTDETPTYQVVNIRQFAAFETQSGPALSQLATVSYAGNTGMQWTQNVRIRPIRQVAPDSLFLERQGLTSEALDTLFKVGPAVQESAEEMSVLQFQY